MTGAPNDRFPVLASTVGAGRRLKRVADRLLACEPLGPAAIGIAPATHQHQCVVFYCAAVMQSAFVLYGLVAALTAVSVWSKHSQVSDIVSGEATAIASLWRDLGGYPQRERELMRDVLRSYTNQIIQEAWPNKDKAGLRVPDGVDGPFPCTAPGVRTHVGIAETPPCRNTERL